MRRHIPAALVNDEIYKNGPAVSARQIDQRANVMALDFLNNCRSFDPKRKTLNFWGHDVIFEVAFRLNKSALHRLTGLPEVDEAAALAVFDSNRTLIGNAARRLHQDTSKRYCELSASNFLSSKRFRSHDDRRIRSIRLAQNH